MNDRTERGKELAFRILLGLVGLGLPLFAILTGQMIVAGMLLSLALGGFMLVSGIGSKSREPEGSKVIKAFTIAFGLFFLLAGLGLLVWLFNGAPIPGWREMRTILSLEQFLLIAGLFGVNFLSQVLKKYLDRQLIKRIQNQRPKGGTYPIPSFFTGVMILVLMLLVPVDLFLILGGLASWLFQIECGVDLSLGLGLPGLLSPILFFTIGMIRHNSGAVVLNGQEITRYRYFSKKSLKLVDITQIKIIKFALPTAVCLKCLSQKLSFPTSIDGYPELLQILRAYTGLSIQKRRKRKVSAGLDEVAFPYSIGFSNLDSRI